MPPQNSANKYFLFFAFLLLVAFGSGFLVARLALKPQQITWQSLLSLPSSPSNTDSPLFTLKTANILGATIMQITKNSVSVKSESGLTDTFPVSEKALIISADPANKFTSSDLSLIKPGEKMNLVFEFVNNTYRVSQFVALKGTTIQGQTQPTSSKKESTSDIYKDLAKLASFVINSVSINGRIVSISNGNVTIETPNKDQASFPLSKTKVTVKRFDVATSTQTTSSDINSVPTDRNVGITLSPLQSGNGSFEIVEFFYSK